ncbi:MAG: DUF1015 domain-containing protein [Candidatus Omnitrophica bacterium]|nr:DUF1015 domain-containing protein [Candidatus Omnitrophota bacterium]
MPSIKPFKAVVYNRARVKDFAKVVAPPYDIIPPKMREGLYKRHPNNIVRLILGKTYRGDSVKDNRYTRAGAFFRSWLKEGVMTQDSRKAFYVYSQSYKADGKKIERLGFIGLMKLGLGKKRTVLPHEKTLLAPKQDRLNLMRTVNANLSPIFILYEDRRHVIARILKKCAASSRPLIDINEGGVRHRVWRLGSGADIAKIERLMGPKNVFIADGHHRYEVACNYAAELEAKNVPEEMKRNSKYFMVYFVESDERMLTILPAHRVVKDTGGLTSADVINKLGKFFEVEKASGLASVLARIEKLRHSCAFGLYAGKGGYYVLRLKSYAVSDRAIKKNSLDWRRLDVTILHLFVLERVLGVSDNDDNVEFVKDPKEAAQLVDKGRGKAAFFLNPTKARQVTKVALHGEKMPRKATYFYPKPLSGLTVNKF